VRQRGQAGCSRGTRTPAETSQAHETQPAPGSRDDGCAAPDLRHGLWGPLDAGSPLAWFNGRRALEPAALAPDWIPFRSSPLIAYQTSLRILTGCTQVWISHTQPGTLTLAQAIGGLPDLAVTDAYNRAAPVRVRVHGHIGIAAGLRIEWTEGDRVLLLTGERAGKPWSPAELLAIADTTP
jgi:hypothetical protein